MRLQGRLCVPDIGNLRQRIMAKAYGARYPIHPSTTKMYRKLQKIYWWCGMKKDIANFVVKCATYQQVKIEHQRPGGVMQEFSILT